MPHARGNLRHPNQHPSHAQKSPPQAPRRTALTSQASWQAGKTPHANTAGARKNHSPSNTASLGTTSSATTAPAPLELISAATELQNNAAEFEKQRLISSLNARPVSQAASFSRTKYRNARPKYFVRKNRVQSNGMDCTPYQESVEREMGSRY